MYRGVLVITMLVSTLRGALAQFGDIAGVLTDSASGETIPFGHVMLLDSRRGVSANASGFFLIPRVPAGVCQLTVKSIGYRTFTQAVNVPERGTIHLRLALLEEPIELWAVNIVESEGRELSKIQSSLHVLDQHESRQVPAAVQQDVFRSLSILPGIVSTSDVSARFYVRGGSGDQNLILLDGMRIYNPYHALGIFSIFDGDLVQQTFVHNGAYPAQYGGRLSSVVALRSRSGRTTSPKFVAGFNPLSARLSAESPISEKIAVLAHARASISSSPLRRFLDQGAPLEFYDVFVKATHRSLDGSSAFGLVTFHTGDRLRPSSPDDADYVWSNSVVGVTASGLLSERLYVSQTTYTSQFRARRDQATSNLTPLLSSVADLTFRTDATLYTEGGREYHLGFEASFPTMEYQMMNSLDRSIRLKEAVPDVSAWARTVVSWSRWTWDLGLHIDGTLLLKDGAPYAVQPRVSGNYSLDESWRLKMAYGRFSQHEVTVNNEDEIISLFDAWIAVPDNVGVETSDHVVVGVSGSMHSVVGIDLQAYFKRYGTLVSFNPEKIEPSDPDYVGATGSSRGVEALVRCTNDPLEVLLSYTLGWSLLDVRGLKYAPRYDRRHSIKSLAVYRVTPQFDVSARWDYGSGLPFTPSLAYYNRITFGDALRDPKFIEPGNPYIALGEKNSSNLPTFHRLDVSASWRFDVSPFKFTFSGSLLNVYNRRNIFYFDRQSGRRINSLSFLPSAQVTVEYR